MLKWSLATPLQQLKTALSLVYNNNYYLKCYVHNCCLLHSVHFGTELSEHRVVRLIFNGKLLKQDTETLAHCGLFDNCVVHCHVSQPKPPPPPPNTNTGMFYLISMGDLKL